MNGQDYYQMNQRKGYEMKLKISNENVGHLHKYCRLLEQEMKFNVSLEQAINRLIQITLGENNGNTD